MRWAWRDATRFRDWERLEQFAKEDPCGQLADTIYELAIGLDDKADVRAAKKVLYILEQKGFTPSQTSGPRLTKYDAASAAKFGVLSTTDWNGMQYVALVHTSGRKVRLVSGMANHGGGYCKLETLEFPFGQLHRLRGRIMLEGKLGYKTFVVSPEYMANRLAWYRDNYGLIDPQTNERDATLPSYWSKVFDERPKSFDDLAESVPAASLGSVDPIEYWREHPWARQWRLPICEGLYKSLMPGLRHIEARVADPAERVQRRIEFFTEHRAEVVKEFFAFDYERRFMDLAAMAMIEGDEVTAQRCKRCQVEIEQRGTSSRFFDSLIVATAGDLGEVAAWDLVDTKHFLFH